MSWREQRSIYPVLLLDLDGAVVVLIGWSLSLGQHWQDIDLTAADL